MRSEPEAPRTTGRRWTAAVAAAALAFVGIGAGALAGYQWDRVVRYETPYAFDLAPGEATRPIVDHVVLVVVDGLRLDIARELPTFRSLGASGSFLVARTAQPALSLPGWTNLTSGAPPEISGVTTNWYEGRVRVDSVFDAARRAGVTTAVAGGIGWKQLYGDVVDHGSYVDDERTRRSDDAIVTEALAILERDGPGLLVVHLPDTDHRAHERGVGAEYRAAARNADALIASIVEAAGTDTAFLLTADHGHIDEGGHGGPEEVVTRVPLVLAGDGLVPGARGEIAQSDVAPTIAALLGIARPSHATGELRDVLLDASDDDRAAIIEAHDAVSARFFERASAVIGGSGTTRAAFDGAREDRLRRDILVRLPVAMALLALALIAALLGSRRSDIAGIAAAAAAFAVVWALAFVARGLTFSFSHFNTEDNVRAFLVARLLDAAVAVVVAGLVAGLVSGWRRRHVAAFATGLGASAWAMLGIGIGIGVYFTIFGWGVTWRLPNLSAGFAALLGLLAMLVLGATAWLSGLLALGAARFVASRRG